ncbi:hypothetical protein ACFX2H_009814 [Malus domestica]
MQNLPNVRYVSFNFHHVCGNSNFENLWVLYEQISEQFEKQGYFLVDAKGNILEEQKGIVRSNCIDCLDRTNVTQSCLAQKSLDAQLQRTGVLDSFERISMFAEDYQTFRALWAEQGDEISLEYAGTYALKGDLVRMAFGRMLWILSVAVIQSEGIFHHPRLNLINLSKKLKCLNSLSGFIYPFVISYTDPG